MNKPIFPKQSFNGDTYSILFEYLPALIKHYTLQGMLFNEITSKEDFQYALSFSHHDGPNPKHYYKSLVYIWAFHSKFKLNDLISFLDQIDESQWFDDKNRKKGTYTANELISQFLGKEAGEELCKAIHDYPTALGIGYVDYGYGEAKKYGSTSKIRVVAYLKELSTRFNNYKEILEERYEMTDEFSTSQGTSLKYKDC